MTPLPELPAENLYGHTKKLRYILARVETFRRGRSSRIHLLDYGCGNGEAVSRYLIGEGIDYTGVDFHEPSLRHAQERFGAPGVRFASQLPDGEVFDVVVCSDVIEHLPAPVETLEELREHIAQGGVLIGSVPNGWGPFELESWIGRWTGLNAFVDFAIGLVLRVWYRIVGWPTVEPEPPYNSESGHLQFFTRSSLGTTLERAGWKLDDFRNGSFLGASITARFLRGQWVMRANNAVADRLPYWAVSTWYFTAQPKNETPGPPVEG